jgi:hypothetical protein
MTAYRKSAKEPEPVAIAAHPAGLVRANGSHCTCTPPGRFMCWWFSVQLGDRWYCKHGGAWVRDQQWSHTEHRWSEVKP